MKLQIRANKLIVLILSLMLLSTMQGFEFSYAAEGEETPQQYDTRVDGAEITKPEVLLEDCMYLVQYPYGTDTIQLYMDNNHWGDDQVLSIVGKDETFESEEVTREDCNYKDGWWTIDLSSGLFKAEGWDERIVEWADGEYDPYAQYHVIDPLDGTYLVIQIGGKGDPLEVGVKESGLGEFHSPISLELGTVRNNTTVESKQDIVYTLDGTDPKDSPSAINYHNGDEILFEKNTLVSARTKVEDNWGPLCQKQIYVRPGKPIASPDGGEYGGSVSVNFSRTSDDTEIYYTLDGSTPSRESLKYDADKAIIIDKDTILKAVAYEGNMSPSEVSEAKYSLSDGLSLSLEDGESGSWSGRASFSWKHQIMLVTPLGKDNCKVVAKVAPQASLKVNGEEQSLSDDGHYHVTLTAVKVEGRSNDQLEPAKYVFSVVNNDKVTDYEVFCIEAICDGLPDEVTDYFCVGSQYTNGGFDDVEATLAGGASVMDCASMGNFGGYATFYYKDGVKNDKRNPYGVDFLVIGNSFDGTTEAAEPGNVLVSEDGSKWYTLAGSIHYDSSVTWNQKITYYPSKNYPGMTDYNLYGIREASLKEYEYPLKHMYPLHTKDEDYSSYTTYGTLLHAEKETNNYGNIMPPYPAFGYADTGYCNSYSNEAENPYAGLFKGGMVGHDYQYRILTNRNGDAFDLDWAVDENGEPVELNNIHYIKVQTATCINNYAIGEKSTEVCCIRTAKPDASDVGVTSPPESIAIDGKTISGEELKTDTVQDVNVDGIFDVQVKTAEKTNVYINSIKSATAYFDKAPQGIVRIIVQEGKKAPTIFYYRIHQGEQSPSKKVTRVTLDANDGLLNDKEKLIGYFDEDTIQHQGDVLLEEPMPQTSKVAFYQWKNSNDDATYTQIDKSFLEANDDITLTAKYAKAEDVEAAKKVTEQIEALKDKEDLTAEDADAVKAARDAYDALTDAQKELISAETLTKLTEAEAAVSAAKVGDVIKQIEDIPDADNLTLEDKEKVEAAREAYDSLTEEDQAKVTNSPNLKVAEATIAKLEAEDKATKAEDRAAAAEAKVAEAEAKAAAAEAKVKEAEDKVAEAQAKLEELQKDKAADEEALAKAEKDLEKANADLKAAKAEQETTAERLEKAQNELKDAEEKAAKAEASQKEAAAAAEAAAAGAQDEIEALKAKLAIEQQKNAVLSKTVKILKPKAKKKSALIRWKKADKGLTYVVYRSTKPTKGFKKAATSKKLKVTVKKLKKGKTYYFKVRAYKKIAGKTVWTGYSKVVKVKIKK